MSSSLLVTKLYFPAARPARVRRPRLVERLETGLQGPLTLLSAPAGYGKSTLMAEWRATPENQMPAAWVSLDAGDNNLITFLRYVAAALDTLEGGLTAHTRLLLQSEQPLPATSLLTALVNDVDRYPADFVLALDDCHVITDEVIFMGLDFLVQNAPPKMHLVLLSRSDPELPLARLRARGQLVEIRAEHFRFTREEAAQFLVQVMGLELTPTQVAALEKRSEGWIVGLHMAALSMQGRSREELAVFVDEFTGSHRYIMDYLVGDVLVSQTAVVRDFLLKTSILERLSAWLCEAITGQGNSQEILHKLEGANLFLVPLDDERDWYRYHHLFADVLQNRLRVEMPDQVNNLHRRAAESLVENGLFFEAIEHAYITQDYDFIRDLCRQSHAFLMRTEHRAAVNRLFERFPREYLHTEPWLCVLYAWVVWGEGKMQQAEDLLTCARMAYESLRGDGRLPVGDVEYEGLPAEILAFEALIHTQKGDPARVLELADQALGVTPAEAPVISAIALQAQQVAYRQKGEMERAIESSYQALPLSRDADNIGIRVSVLHSLGVGLMIQGKLTQLIQVYEEGLQYAKSRGEIEHPRYDLIYFKMADVAYVRNQLDQAEGWLMEGFRRSQRNTYLWSRFYGMTLQMQVMLAKGEQDRARNLMVEGDELLAKIRGAYFEAELVATVMMMRVLIGKLDGVQAWAESCQHVLKEPLDYMQLEPGLQLAYTWEALGEGERAIQLAEQIEKITARVGCKHLQLYALRPQILAWAKKGNLAKAQECLSRALALAKEEGYIRVFIDGGEIMREQVVLAGRSPQNDGDSDMIRRLLAVFGAAGTMPPAPARQPLISPLSKRELEVLGLIAAGYTNKEIASACVIAIGTVKRHTVNIFTKLDVRNRTEAVVKGRELGLL